MHHMMSCLAYLATVEPWCAAVNNTERSSQYPHQWFTSQWSSHRLLNPQIFNMSSTIVKIIFNQVILTNTTIYCTVPRRWKNCTENLPSCTLILKPKIDWNYYLFVSIVICSCFVKHHLCHLCLAPQWPSHCMQQWIQGKLIVCFVLIANRGYTVFTPMA